MIFSNTSSLNQVLGCSIGTCSANDLDIYTDQAVSYICELIISFSNPKNEFFSLLFKGGEYVEDEEGTMFHDYEILKVDSGIGENDAKVHCQTSPIVKICVYNRPILNAFEQQTKFEKFTAVEDAFLFICRNGEKLLLAYRPWAPAIQLIWNKHEEFFEFEAAQNYELSREITS